MTELERLQKAVVDTEAAWDAAYDAAYAADAVGPWDDAEDAEDAAWVALVKAKQELFKYLKEKDK